MQVKKSRFDQYFPAAKRILSWICFMVGGMLFFSFIIPEVGDLLALIHFTICFIGVMGEVSGNHSWIAGFLDVLLWFLASPEWIPALANAGRVFLFGILGWS